MATYDPANWYWVFGNRVDIFSSAIPGYIADGDPTYMAWLAEGNLPSGGNYMTDGELTDVLFRAQVPGNIVLAVQPTDWGTLDKAYVAAAIAPYAGVTLTYAAFPWLNATYELIGSAYDAFLGVLNYTQLYATFPISAPQLVREGEEIDPTAAPLPQGTFTWVTRGTSVTFRNIADIKNTAKALADYKAAWNSWAWQGGAQTTWGIWSV